MTNIRALFGSCRSLRQEHRGSANARAGRFGAGFGGSPLDRA